MYCAGLVCEVKSIITGIQHMATLLIFCRCTSPPHDFDGDYVQRSREHTELLVKELELGVLWDEYGLVGDLVVRNFCFSKNYSLLIYAAIHK